MKSIILALLLILVPHYSFGAGMSKKSALSLLQVEESPEDIELLSTLKTRRQMLNWHTYTAWTTVALMGATLITAPDGKHDNTHKWLGIASGLGYLASASLAYFAPKPEDIKDSNNIFIHKKLIWIHAPAMLLTLAAGLQAHNDRKDNKELGSLADLHGAFASIAAISFGLAAVTSMDWTIAFLPSLGENNKKELACVFTKSF